MNEKKKLQVIKRSLLHLDIWRSWWPFNEAFGGHKRCYDGQWPLTGRYFKRCNFKSKTIEQFSLYWWSVEHSLIRKSSNLLIFYVNLINDSVKSNLTEFFINWVLFRKNAIAFLRVLWNYWYSYRYSYMTSH